MGHSVAILGASGYAGGELVRLVDQHPVLELGYLGAHSSAGRSLGEVHPHLPGGDRVLGPLDEVPDVDLAFLALPHGASADAGKSLADRGIRVCDLGSDYRFATAASYADAYGHDHPIPGELGSWVYGLPELFRANVAGATKVAVPGCYPTSAVLALAPLLAAGMVAERGIVVDAISGVTGAGRGMRDDLTFGAVAEGTKAYGVTTHRHRPEMEQALSAHAGRDVSLVFTPHLAPFQRGLLSTCYAATEASAAELRDALDNAYADEPYVHVGDQPPQTRWVAGSNHCLLAAFVDGRAGTAVVVSAIDNLLKGAAGQAVQCANLMLGIDETAGLPTAGWLP